MDLENIKEITPGYYHMTGNEFIATDEVIQDFNENGYIIIKGLLSNKEVTRLRNEIDRNPHVMENEILVDDGKGRKTAMVFWNHPSKDITGMIARSEKVAGTVDKLLGEESYHYHSKLMMKKAKEGGEWIWHQDYGYWYNNGLLYPDLLTVWIAVDNVTRNNGCMQYIPKSHKMGRIDGTTCGEQVRGDMERIRLSAEANGVVYVELAPGDVAIHHSNLIHCSTPNLSEDRRWGLAIAYNKATNNPYKEHHHPFYTPLVKVPNSAIMECAVHMKDGGIDFQYTVHNNRTKKQKNKMIVKLALTVYS